MRGKPAPHVFVFRSTLVPGTVEDVLRPIIERESGKREGADFHVCFQPEFLREGTSIRDYDKPPFTVVGASAEAPVARLRELFGHLPCEFHRDLDPRGGDGEVLLQQLPRAEDHVRQRDRAAVRGAGVDPFEVMDLVCQDRQLNISPAYLKPGFRLRRLVPAQGSARDDVSRQDARRRAADAGSMLPSNRGTSSTRSPRCWLPASGGSA